MIKRDGASVSAGADGPDATPAWHVAHTRSRQEKGVADLFRAGGLEVWLPTVRRERWYGSRRRESEIVLFTGYVFARGGRSRVFEVAGSGRLVSLLTPRDQPRLEHEMEQIRRAMDAGMLLDPHPYVERGWRVRVSTGPLRGVEGLVESRTRPDRLLLQIGSVARGLALEIASYEVEVVEAPEAAPASTRGGLS